MSAPTDEQAPIRVVLYSDSPVIGGGENFARDLLANLRPPFEPILVGTRSELVAHIASGRPGMETRVLPPVQGRGDLGSLRAQVSILRQLSPDVVHINQHLWSGQYGVLACALAGLPSVCVVHGALPPASSSQRYLTMATSRLARHFVGVSHFVTARIRAELHVDGRRVSMIYNGIPSLEPAASGQAQPLPGTILGVGRLTGEKGFDLLVRAMPQLPGRRLLLAGDGPERASLEALAASLDVDDRVEFAGWVSEPWASRFRPDLVVVPSRFEAMPLVVLEAMRAGIPVVATRVGGTPELVVDHVTGRLAEPENPTSLAETAESVLADPAGRELMAVAAKRRLEERFTDTKMIDSYEALYATVSGHPTPRPDAGGGESFGPAGGSRNERLLGLAQILPPETRERMKDLVHAGKNVWRARSLTASPPAAASAATPASEFVRQHLDAVRGDILVLGEPELGDVVRASGQLVDTCVVSDLEPRNLQASLMVDPLETGSFGQAAFDSELVVGTKWQGSDRFLVMENLWQALRPGGTLLFAVPAAGVDGPGDTDKELRELIGACSPAARAEIVSSVGPPTNGHDASAPGEPQEWLAALIERANEVTA
jgi:glycosyltransferase involved in cell wall biosynthesis